MSVAQEFVLRAAADLADELDPRRCPEQRLEHLLEIRPLLRVDLGGDSERHAGPAGDLDRGLDPLLGRQPAKEGEVVARGLAERVQVAGQPVVDRGPPVRPGIGRRWASEIDTSGTLGNAS